MPRVKSNVARLKRKNKIMKLAKGYFGGRSKTVEGGQGVRRAGPEIRVPDRRRKRPTFAGSGSRASTRPHGCTSCRTAAS